MIFRLAFILPCIVGVSAFQHPAVAPHGLSSTLLKSAAAAEPQRSEGTTKVPTGHWEEIPDTNETPRRYDPQDMHFAGTVYQEKKRATPEAVDSWDAKLTQSQTFKKEEKRPDRHEAQHLPPGHWASIPSTHAPIMPRRYDPQQYISEEPEQAAAIGYSGPNTLTQSETNMPRDPSSGHHYTKRVIPGHWAAIPSTQEELVPRRYDPKQYEMK